MEEHRRRGLPEGVLRLVPRYNRVFYVTCGNVRYTYYVGSKGVELTHVEKRK